LALGITIDDLLHGGGPDVYRIGRRPDDPHRHSEQIMTLLANAGSGLKIDLVHIGPREAARPLAQTDGTGIVAVGAGLVAVEVGGLTPALRVGEVLVAPAGRIEAWRNIGQTEAMLFWMVQPPIPEWLRSPFAP